MSAIRRNPRFFTTVTRKRRSPGAYVDGVWVDGAVVSETEIAASVQPAGGRDLLKLPEGLRTEDVVKIFTDDALQVGNETDGQVADRIVHLDEEYEVVEAESWAMAQMPHIEALAVRVARSGLPRESP